MPEPEKATTNTPRMQLGPIRGKVAQIITARSVALNIGSAQGVTVDMVFAILNKKASAIKDPDTGKELGSLTVPKVMVKAYVVDQNLTLARTYRLLRRGMFSPLPSLFGTEDHVETLRVTEHAETEEFNEADSIVKIGDPAVQVLNAPQGE